MAVVTKALLRKLERIKNRIAKDRDELRDLINEVEALEGDVSDAAESLNYAADAMSRLV